MLKDELKVGNVKFGSFVSSTVIGVTEVLGEVGYDFVVYDTQHGIIDDNQLRTVLLAALNANLAPIVRVPGPYEHKIIHALDYKAKGVIIPGVDTVEDAKKMAELTKFYPLGKRGLNPGSPEAKHGLIPVKEYMEKSNAEGITLIMLETKYMVEHIEELCEVDSIDGVFIGPNDLSVSYGLFGDINDVVVKDAINHVADVCRKKGKIVGIYCGSVENAREYKEMGINMLSYSNDFKLLQQASVNVLEQLKNM